MKPDANYKSNRDVRAGIAVANALAVHIADLFLEVPISMPLLYVASVVLVIRSSVRMIYVITMLCIVLTFVGAFLTQNSFGTTTLIYNRFAVATLLVITGSIGIANSRLHKTLLALNKQLDHRVKGSNRELQISSERRDSLNRALHDDVLQSLYGVTLTLEAPAQSAEATHSSQQKALTDLNLIMLRIREYMLDRNPILGATPLAQTLRDVASDLSANRSTKFTIEIDPALEIHLSALEETALVLIIREAMTNCARHAEAQSCKTTLRHHDGVIGVCISDDGKGFDRSATEALGRFGLRNMMSRARELNWEVQLDTARGKGTRVWFDVPLQGGQKQ